MHAGTRAGVAPPSGIARILLGVALAVAAAVPLYAQLPIPSSGQPDSAPPDEQVGADPYGRETPRSCLYGFLRACRRGNMKAAAEYLEIPPSVRGAREAIAHQLAVVFDHRFMTTNLDQVSRAKRGSLEDDLEPDTDRGGELRGDDGLIDILVVRRERPDGSPIWLISWETVRECRRLYESLGLRDIETRMPRALVDTRIAGMALWQVLGTLLLLPLLYGVAWVVVSALVGSLRRLRRESAAAGLWAQSARSPATVLLTLVLHRVAVVFLGMPALYRLFYDRVLRVLLLAGLLWFLLRLIDNFDRRVLSRILPAGASARHATLSLGRRFLKIAAFLLIVLLGLASFGVNLTATLAGLGIGGLALAFAAQKSLANLFGGVAVLTDNVIRVGDTCRIGGQTGEIEDVTLWSTRLRTSERTVVSIPNGVVMESQIENLSRRDKFWFHPVVGLVYETSADQLNRVLQGIRGMLAADPRVDTADARVRFLRLGESSLDLEVFAYVRSATLAEFLEVQEELLLRLLEIVAEAGTAIAFPSRTLYFAERETAAPA
jgi:MscS family membrane protein